jgi:two-component system OmpR family response regulator
MRHVILLAEDEADVAQEIVVALSSLGYDVNMVDTVAEVINTARSEEPSLLIVDRMLHGEDSLNAIETLRKNGPYAPVIFISALTAIDERIRGLKAGGDDYITKPFAMDELSARVKALLRRSPPMRATMFKAGPLEIDLIERRAWRGDRELSLKPREFKLLEYLMRHADEVVSRAMLFEDVWNYHFRPQTQNLVDVHIGKLRREVDAPGETPLIVSVRGIGFMLSTANA